MGKEWWGGPQGVHPPVSLTLSSVPMEVSHRVVGDQHHWLPVWPVVGFCVSCGQQPAGKGYHRDHRIQFCLLQDALQPFSVNANGAAL